MLNDVPRRDLARAIYYVRGQSERALALPAFEQAEREGSARYARAVALAEQAVRGMVPPEDARLPLL